VTRQIKVVHLSSVHRASDTRIFHKECHSLVQAGYDVTLIARHDRDETVDGIKIRAVRSGVSNRLIRMTKSVFDVLRMALEEDGDIYHFHDPELIPVGLVLKLRHKRVVYDVHESVSKQIRSKFWIPAQLRAPVADIYRLLERSVAQIIDGVVVATPGIAEYFPPAKTVVVQNLALVEEFASIDTSDYASRESLVVYIGGITRARGIQEMVDAMHLTTADARMLLGGSFAPPALEAEMQARPGYERVDSLGWLERNGVRQALSRARVGLLVLHPEPNYLDSYPVKLYEYLAAGLPVIASDFPFWEQFVKDIGAGLMVDPLDTVAVSEAINWLFEHPDDAQAMGQRGREAVSREYSWENEAKKLVDFYAGM
jgi:glycosyltransferase involved in cell wall biosynthesis